LERSLIPSKRSIFHWISARVDRARWLLNGSMNRGVLVCVIVILTVGSPRAQTVISREPYYESAVDSNRIAINWGTNKPDTSEILWGLTSAYELGRASTLLDTSHAFSLTELNPATTYYVKLRTRSDSVTFFTSTASDFRSTGEVQVYFNRSIDSTWTPPFLLAHGNSDYLGLLRNRIAHAKYTIDVAVYSFSGFIADSVTYWLVQAQARGLSVRLIADSSSVANSAAYKRLKASGVPTIINSFGNNHDVASNIHHNKFIIIDGRAGDGSTTWLLTGSWNLSANQTTIDYQNILYIQDLALARAYTREFNEEWGSVGDIPDTRYAKFSTHKTDNTPRSFNIKGIRAHLYFSPNGGAFAAINSVLQRAEEQVLFSVFSFTRQEFAQALIKDHQAGVDIHGIIDNTDKYEQTAPLQAAGIDVLSYSGSDTVLFHHKYAIIDAGKSSTQVITGSYNWSNSAENSNNENTLIIASPLISNAYFEEWSARYKENGGVQKVLAPQLVVLPSSPEEMSIALSPNPSRGVTSVYWKQKHFGRVRVGVWDVIGRVRAFEEFDQAPGKARLALPEFIAPGIYQICVEHDGTKEFSKLVVPR
jgi:phosphatidylserine/phosphatidylglycerophosphate/cardiolipin synthase-like enzyme